MSYGTYVSINLHIQSLTCEDVIKQISKGEYRDVCETIQLFDVTGKDLLELKEFAVRLKLGNKVDKHKLHRFQSLIRDVQATPHKFFPSDTMRKRFHDDANKTKPLLKPKLKPTSKLQSTAMSSEPVEYKLNDLQNKINKINIKNETPKLRHRSDSYVVLNDEQYEDAPIPKSYRINEDVKRQSSDLDEPKTTEYVADVETKDDSATYRDLPRLNIEKPPEIIIANPDDYLKPITKPATDTLLEHKFYRCVDRHKGRQLLEQTKKGSYLLRHSSEKSYLGTLMINGIAKVQNVPICYNQTTQKYYFVCEMGEATAQLFNDLNDMLEYYTRNDINGDLLLRDDDNKPPSINECDY